MAVILPPDRPSATHGQVFTAPKPPSHFVGRTQALDAIAMAIGRRQRVLLTSSSPSPGVGKSSLAALFAQALRDAFHEGVVWIKAPVFDPYLLALQLGRALGTDVTSLAPPGDAARALERLLNGRRILLVLDDLNDPRLLNLIPAVGPSVLCTSDDPALSRVPRLHTVSLGVFSPAEADQLAQTMLGLDRWKLEPVACRDVHQLLQYHPLALRLAFGALQENLPVSGPAVSLLSRDLRNLMPRLQRFGGERRWVGAAAARCLESLPADVRAVAHAASILPPRSFSMAALASVASLSMPETGQALERLARLGLIQPQAEGRFSVHPLLVDPLGELGPTDELKSRAAAWYLSHCLSNSDLLTEIDLEIDGILSGMAIAMEQGEARMVKDFALALGPYFDARGFVEEVPRRLHMGLAAARHTQDMKAEGRLNRWLGRLFLRRGATEAARERLEASLSLASEQQDKSGRVTTMLDLARTAMACDKPEEALNWLEQCLSITRGRMAEEGHILLELARVLQRLGRQAEALKSLEACLTWARKRKDLGLEAEVERLNRAIGGNLEVSLAVNGSRETAEVVARLSEMTRGASAHLTPPPHASGTRPEVGSDVTQWAVGVGRAVADGASSPATERTSLAKGSILPGPRGSRPVSGDTNTDGASGDGHPSIGARAALRPRSSEARGAPGQATPGAVGGGSDASSVAPFRPGTGAALLAAAAALPSSGIGDTYPGSDVGGGRAANPGGTANLSGGASRQAGAPLGLRGSEIAGASSSHEAETAYEQGLSLNGVNPGDVAGLRARLQPLPAPEAMAQLKTLFETGEPQDQLDAAEVLADYLLKQGQPREAEQTLTRGAELAARTGQPLKAAGLIEQVGKLMASRGQTEVAMRYLERSFRLRDSAGDRSAAARTLQRMGQVAADVGDYDTAFYHFMRGLDRTEALPDAAARADALFRLGLIFAARGDDEEALSHFDMAEEMWLETRDLQGLSAVLQARGRIFARRSRHDDALRAYGRSVELAEGLGDDRLKASGYHQLGILEAEAGNYGAANDYYKKSLLIKRSMSDLRGMATTLHAMAQLEAANQRPAEARQHYERVLEIASQLSNHRLMSATYRALGDVLNAEGRYQDALSRYDEAARQPGASHDRREQVAVLLGRGTALTELGRLDDASETLQKGLELARSVLDRRSEAAALYQLGLTESERGQDEQAISYLQQSLEIDEALGNARGAAMTLAMLGQALHISGMTRDSRVLLQEAARRMTRLNMPELEKVKSWLADTPESA